MTATNLDLRAVTQRFMSEWREHGSSAEQPAHQSAQETGSSKRPLPSPERNIAAGAAHDLYGTNGVGGAAGMGAAAVAAGGFTTGGDGGGRAATPKRPKIAAAHQA